MFTIPDNSIVANMKELSKCNLLNADGKEIPARFLWESQPAILIFLRHFACQACQAHAVEVWKQRKQYESKGALLHFIGNGAPHFINSFKQQNGLDEASFFTDPSLKAFRAAGFRKGFWIDPGEMHSRGEFIWLAIRYQMKMTNEGNVWQLGGVLVISPQAEVKYQFISQAMGDFPPMEDIPTLNKITRLNSKKGA